MDIIKQTKFNFINNYNKYDIESKDTDTLIVINKKNEKSGKSFLKKILGKDNYNIIDKKKGKDEELFSLIENKKRIHVLFYDNECISLLKNCLDNLCKYSKKILLNVVVFNNEQIMELVKNINLLLFHLDYFKQKNEKYNCIKNIDISFNTNIRNGKKTFEEMIVKSKYVNIARCLQLIPSNILTPDEFVNIAEYLLKDKKVMLEKIHKKGLELYKCGGIIGVGQGSDQKPNLLLAIYDGNKQKDGLKEINNKKSDILNMKNWEDYLVLIGKGVMFDSGGISIKPDNKMYEMKMDMSGSASVLVLLGMLSELKIKKKVIVMMPNTENMPSSGAIKPGDIITHPNNMTTEIRHTDAEGRLMMADCLSYCNMKNAGLTIDLATLTGAAEYITCGHANVIVNSDKAKDVEKLVYYGSLYNDLFFNFPLFDNFDKYVKSNIADVKNAEFDCRNGVIMSSVYLKQFIGNLPWIHIDLSSTIDSMKHDSLDNIGKGTGIIPLFDFITEK